MKLVWAQDFDFLTHGGGAQLTDRAHFLEGVRRGHDLSIWSPSSGMNLMDIKDEVVLASNPAFLSADVFKNMLDRGISYVWFLHDYLPLCKYRLFYPMRDSCKSCYLKDRWLPILLQAKLIIWLSPLHRESWLWLCPELEGVPYHLAPSPVEVRRFYSVGIERRGVVAVESLHPFKGRSHILKWAEEHSDVEVFFIGGNPTPHDFLPPNCRDIGVVPYEQMNEAYNHHEALLHLPQSPSPFDRTVVEAYLAGCRIIGNELIGALSWPAFREGREAVATMCRESPKKFWEAVEGVLGGTT